MHFISACMNVTTQLELCLHEQTQIVANAAWRWVGSDFLAGQLAPYFLTFYYNTYSRFTFFISSLFTFYCTIRLYLSVFRSGTLWCL